MTNPNYEHFNDYLDSFKMIACVKPTQLDSFLSDKNRTEIATMWCEALSELHPDSGNIYAKYDVEPEEREDDKGMIHFLENELSLESLSRAIDVTTAFEIIGKQYLMIEAQKKDIEQMNETISRKSKQVERLRKE